MRTKSDFDIYKTREEHRVITAGRIYGFPFQKAYGNAIRDMRSPVDEKDKQNPYEATCKGAGKSLSIIRTSGNQRFTLRIYDQNDRVIYRRYSRHDQYEPGEILIGPRDLVGIMRHNPDWATCEDGHVIS